MTSEMVQIDSEVERLARKIIGGLQQIPQDRRMLVAIAGPPGSGKSTLAYPLTAHLNALLLHTPEQRTTTDSQTGLTHVDAKQDDSSVYAPAALANGHVSGRGKGTGDGEEEVAICVGLDGWHYSREALDGFEDPNEAHYRRGAAFTFDLPSYTSFLHLLRAPISTSTPATSTSSSSIPFPTFSHALKDPLPSPLPILPQHRIIIIEGLYTMLDRPGWRECAEMMDLRVFVECQEEVCRGRLVKRNWAAGIGGSLEGCRARVDASDMVNGTEVRQHQYKPTDVIYPKDAPDSYS